MQNFLVTFHCVGVLDPALRLGLLRIVDIDADILLVGPLAEFLAIGDRFPEAAGSETAFLGIRGVEQDEYILVLAGGRFLGCVEILLFPVDVVVRPAASHSVTMCDRSSSCEAA